MAFRTQKISQMTPKGANLEATDLIEVSTIESGSYVTRSITGQEIIDAAVGNVDWGDIGGTLSAQTDLQNALDAKQDDITLTTTGDNGASTLVGSTLNVPNYTLSGLGGVPTSRTLTINGVTQDLSANRTFTISTGITIGSTAIASGTVGRILFEGAGNVVQESSSLFWDATNNRLGIGTSSPAYGLDVVGTARVSGILSTPSGLDLAGWYLYASGTSNATLFGGSSWVFDTVAGGGYRFRTAGNTDRLRIESTGNVLIGTTTDSGFRLDVNGTARVQDSTTIIRAQNAATSLNIQNFTNGGSAETRINLQPNSGTFSVGKTSTGTAVYKIIGANTSYLSNTTGDIAFLNDASMGRILMAAGGSSTAQMLIFSTGNVGINTTTDAGFRLDVNGTARVRGVGNTSATTAFTVINNPGTELFKVNDLGDTTIGNNRYLKAFRWTNDDLTKSLQIEGNSNYNVDAVNIISWNNALLNNTKNLLNIGLASTVSTQSSGSTDVFNSVNIQTTYNFAFGTHTVRGIYYNPTLTAMVGTTHFAFHSTSGNIRFENLPTSAAGLPSGTLYNNLGVLMIA